MAYKEGNSELVTYLIENGADINTKSDVGEPILMTACQNKDYEMVKYLIEKMELILILQQKIVVLH